MNAHTLSPKQAASIATSTGRVNLWEGSIRSGKTYATLIRFATVLAAPPAGGEFLIVAKTLDAAYRNIFAPMRREPSLAWLAPHVHYRQRNATATILGHTVNVVSATDAKAHEKIRGMTVAVAYVDEASIIPHDTWREVLGRMSPPGAILLATTNPDSPAHWLKQNYLDRLDELPSWRTYRFSIDDNTALDPAYVDAVKAEYTGIWYDRYILGKWTAAEGAVYPQFNTDRHVANWYDMPRPVLTLGTGIDYGTTNATAAVAAYYCEDGRIWIADEWRINQKDRQQPMTDGELSASYQEWLKVPHSPLPGPAPITHHYVDPAAASFKQQLHRDGVRYVRNAYNHVGDGIKQIATLLAQDRLRITDRCQALIAELPAYVWDTKASDGGQDAPIKSNDHSVDALRYAVASTEAWWRPYIDQHVEQERIGL